MKASLLNCCFLGYSRLTPLCFRCKVKLGSEKPSFKMADCTFVMQSNLQACHSMNAKGEPSPGWFPIKS